ncbi:hypothetical protein G7Y89_g7768 [Cudoniella acicularis]|uniref:F-box domain-containing protein n=1 Tax=Cudoniella acicularis TaxID=354080 RepID=A0A8H4RK62_9HELO|nr:hypothetical protein G7Y89_g7768 [Cudoniella acicularis]
MDDIIWSQFPPPSEAKHIEFALSPLRAMSPIKTRSRAKSRSAKKSPTRAPAYGVKNYFYVSKPTNKSTTRKRNANTNEYDSESDSEALDTIVVDVLGTANNAILIDDDEDEDMIDAPAREELIDESVLEEYTPVNSLDTITSANKVQDSVSGYIFKSLPLELHQQIALLLSSDRDIHNYRFSCRAAREAVDSTIWRKRFSQTFDGIKDLDSVTLAKKYRYRCKVSEQWTVFDFKNLRGKLTREDLTAQRIFQNDTLELFRTLINESNAQINVNNNGVAVVDGLNMNFIRQLISNEADPRFKDIINAVLNTEVDEYYNNNDIVSAKKEETLVLVVQLILTPLSLHPDICNARVFHVDLSQQQAYATAKVQPLFIGKYKQDINVRWLLHTVNFFKFHLKAPVGEGILSQEYSNLEEHQYSQPWAGVIQSGTQKLGKYWKGVHTFLEDFDLYSLRTGGVGDIFSDQVETFQDLEIFFDEEKFPPQSWPAEWERVLQSNPFLAAAQTKRASSRRSSRSQALPDLEVKSFYGTSRCTKTAHFYGRIHAMPQQQGFAGFQRIVLIKCYTTPNGGFNHEQIYCYEGCVFPGGTIVVGRWWHTNDDPDRVDSLMGPFIWWNVERSGLGIDGNGDDAINFLDNF